MKKKVIDGHTIRYHDAQIGHVYWDCEHPECKKYKAKLTKES